MSSLPFRRIAALLLLLPSLLRAQTLEALLAPTVDAEVKRVAALPPVGDPWERNDFLVYAAGSSQGGPNNPEVLVTSATFLAKDPVDAPMLVQRADAWRQLAQYSRALADLDKVPAADAATAEVLFLRAQILQAQGRLPGALAAAQAIKDGNDYYKEEAAKLVAQLTARRADWEKSLRPLLAAPPANPDPALARLALDCGADNLAHDLARRVLATRPDDATARAVLLAVYHNLEPDTPALTLAVHTAAAPLAAAEARAHPTEVEYWRPAVYYATTVVPTTGPAGAAAFATLLREAKAAGDEFALASVMLALCQAPDIATLRKLGDEYAGVLATEAPLQQVLNNRLLAFSPAQPALLAAQANPARAELWAKLLATARPEIEARRLPGTWYADFLTQAAAAGHAFPAEQIRAKLYAADSNYDLIQAIRAALPETRTQPDLEATITALSRRFTDIPPSSLGFMSVLTAPAGGTPLFTEQMFLTPEMRAGLEGLKPGLLRARTLLQLGTPGEALAELAHATPADTATTELWMLRAHLLQLAGRPEEALLALDRARFLAGKPFDLPNDEQIEGFATATLRADLLAACQHAVEAIVPLEDHLATHPDDADAWGRLARAWSEGSLRCVPKALAAAARARQINPGQRDAIRAEFNSLGNQLRVMPSELAGPVAALLANRLGEFTDEDWLLRVVLLRALPHDTRKTLAAKWADEIRPKRDRLPDGKLLEQAFRLQGVKTLNEVEEILGSFDKLPATHALQFERSTAQLVQEAFLRQRGWFIGEPEHLDEEEIDVHNISAGLRQVALASAREQTFKASGRQLIANLQELQAGVWEVYEGLRLQSHEGFPLPADWKGTAEEFTTKVIATGRFGPATATTAPTAGCVPYFPGLTSEERKLATQCIALLLETTVGLDQARLTTIAIELFRRQETRDRDINSWQHRIEAISGGGDEHEFPDLPAAVELTRSNRYAEAYVMVKPLLDRGVQNYYVEIIAGGYANQQSRYDEGMRHFARAKSYVAAVPSLAQYVDSCVAVVRRNLDSDRTNRRAAIQARLAYLDEFVGYLRRDAEGSVARAKGAVASMAELQKSNITYYNADSLQHEADKLGLMHDNAKSRLQEIVRQMEEIEAERAKLRQELSRL